PGLFCEGPPVRGIFLSHAHPDHAGLIQHTLPSIPVYSTRLSFKMIMAASIFANLPGVDKERERPMEPGMAVNLGPFQVTSFPVDHSVPGACAFVIEAVGKRIFYTGDLRFHGRKPGMRHAIMEASRSRCFDLVITEGTCLSRSPTEETLSEQELEEKGVAMVSERTGLVVANFSPLNLDRLVSFLRISKRTGRTFVIDAYGAYVLMLAGSEGIRVPDPCRSKATRILIPEGFWVSRSGKTIGAHRSRMESNSIGLSEITNHPERFLALWRPSMLERLFGGSLPKGTLCLRSLWKGYLETHEERRLAATFEAGGVEQRHLHASGHAGREGLVAFLKELDARSVLVVHTERPGALGREFGNLILADDGSPITI
ncbi:MAG: MBL fold metallo-hydrolase, partial [Verrucomicrobiae bacterium]|nr:MBL fold metallo-hydrolase [Verrucomicrobiae bacterium]